MEEGGEENGAGGEQEQQLQSQEQVEIEEYPSVPSNPCNSMKLMNNSARISSFQMSDGPLGISLNVYDGKSLKSLVATLLDTVNDQAKIISGYEDRFRELEEKIAENDMKQSAKADGINDSVRNLAQNIQGFVDDDAQQPDMQALAARESRAASRNVSPVLQRGGNASSSFEVIRSSPVNIGDLPPKSPETVPAEVHMDEKKEEDCVESQPVATSMASPTPAASPTPTPTASPPKPSPEAPNGNPMRSERSLLVRALFKKCVKRIIMQIRMKNMCVGVLTSRAQKGMSIGERLKSLEDLIYGKFKGVENDIVDLGGKSIENAEALDCHVQRMDEKHRIYDDKHDATSASIRMMSDKIDVIEDAAQKQKEGNDDQTKKIEGLINEKAKEVNDRVDVQISKFNDFCDRSAEIVVTSSEVHKASMIDCLQSCKSLTAEVEKAGSSGESSLTSDQVFELRRQMGVLEARVEDSKQFMSTMGAYLEVDSSLYDGLKQPRNEMKEGVEGFEEAAAPLWGVVNQFDNSMAQSINLLTTLQSGFTNQSAAIESLQSDLLSKAGKESIDILEARAREMSEKNKEIEGGMVKIGGDVNTLSVNNADLSEKVYKMADEMGSAVDEEKLKESVKKLIDLYVKQLDAKANNNLALVEKIQKELDSTGKSVENLFKTKADVSQVDDKADKEIVESTSNTLEEMQNFISSFGKELAVSVVRVDVEVGGGEERRGE